MRKIVAVGVMIASSFLSISQTGRGSSQGQAVIVSTHTKFIVELTSRISTQINQTGDAFRCKVLGPDEFAGAFLLGRISRVKRSGKVNGRSAISLALYEIILPDGRRGRFDGQIMEIYDIAAQDKGRESDKGKALRRRDDVSAQLAVGVGALIGGFIGSSKGAAIGAVIGSPPVATTTLSAKGPDLEFEAGTQLVVRTTELDHAVKASDSLPPPRPPIFRIQRYPTMECPDEVPVGQQFALQISLTRRLVTPETQIQAGKTTEDGRLALDLPDQREHWNVDVVISAPDFSIRNGANTSTMILPEDGDSSPAVFHLRARPPQGRRQVSKIYATFWNEGTFLAKTAREITIVNPQAESKAVETSEASIQRLSQNLAPVAGDTTVRVNNENVRQINLSLNMEQPDLTLFVLDRISADRRAESEIIIASPYLQPASHRFHSPTGLSGWLDAQYRRFARLNLRGLVTKSRQSLPRSSDERVFYTMRGFGRELYRRFAPLAFKKAFWKLADRLGPRFKTIQIFSDNPVLPWELMRPVREDGSERDFLGIEFVIGRWHLSQGPSQLERPPQLMRIEKFIVVAPQYKEHQNLPAQQQELRALESFRGYTRLPGRLDHLRKLFEDLPQAIIHFAGHGGVESSRENVNEYAIQLEDGILSLMTWKGMTSTKNRNHPFFFLNACDIGQAQKIADFVDGWAPAALEAGASGYIGALWPLGDKGAAEFASHFYKALDVGLRRGQVSIPDVLRDTRRLFLMNSDPTFLAYVYYGDPHLKLVVLGPK